ncbi:MAG: methionyl-tRNA formyltransferase [Ignavibacteria bacterium]
MKIVFMGTPEFSVPSLKILLENNYDIAAVVTAPDKRKGRGRILSESDVKKFAVERGLKILQPEKLKDEQFVNEIRILDPDLIIVVAFRILPKEVFTIPKYGSFNLHASLLPKYRGAAPINHALISGETETGVTTFFLKEKVDTGNIILQKKIEILSEDDAGRLHDKLSTSGAEVVLETVRMIERGNIILKEQDESQASPAPKIFKEDCGIKWDQGSVKINNFIRGLSPRPTAFTFLNERSVKIYRTKLTDIPSGKSAGTLIINNKQLLVSTIDNELEILELQLEGKKRISAADFINGLDRIVELYFTGKK